MKLQKKVNPVSNEDFYQKLLQHRQPAGNALYFFFKDDTLVYITRKLKCEHPFDSFATLPLKGDLIDLEKKFIANYKPYFNVQESDFNLFDYYKNNISMSLSGPQTKMLIQWKETVPSELIKEAMDRVIEKCPDKPFGYLKYFLDDWSEKGYRTLDEVKRDDNAHKTRQKGNGKHAEYERNVEEHGHHKGIPQMDF